ncbi:MAG TPA: TIGR01906 family membrane protein [Bellilinea sp.]|nr:TIGR01906 family membrane protein [Bellilinea sp.]
MKILVKIFQTLITIAIPLVLILTGLRVFFTPPFAIVEYNMPGFPEDPYGFTKEERIHWANISLKYLNNDASIDFLGDLQFADGSAVFNERELGHMVDVKVFFKTMMNIWLGLVIFVVLMGVVAWRTHVLRKFWSAVSAGGWLTLGLLGLILATVFLNFSALFTLFHQLFFVGDTWLFYFSDTLIRLFPMRLWQDLFIAIGALAILGALFLALKGRQWANKSV